MNDEQIDQSEHLFRRRASDRRLPEPPLPFPGRRLTDPGVTLENQQASIYAEEKKRRRERRRKRKEWRYRRLHLHRMQWNEEERNFVLPYHITDMRTGEVISAGYFLIMQALQTFLFLSALLVAFVGFWGMFCLTFTASGKNLTRWLAIGAAMLETLIYGLYYPAINAGNLSDYKTRAERIGAVGWTVVLAYILWSGNAAVLLLWLFLSVAALRAIRQRLEHLGVFDPDREEEIAKALKKEE